MSHSRSDARERLLEPDEQSVPPELADVLEEALDAADDPRTAYWLRTLAQRAVVARERAAPTHAP